MRISTGKKFFFVGLNTGFVSNGLPDQRCCDFYARRSGHGLHCSIVGNVTIPDGVGTNNNTPEISSSPAWRRLSEAIASKGALPGIQLATVWKGYHGRKKFVSPSSAAEIALCKTIANEISTEDVKQLFLRLRIGTDLAAEAGFRHVQLHAAHGYLFSLLIDQRIYLCAERVLEEIREWARRIEAYGIETSFRFSLRTGDPEFDDEGKEKFSDLIASLPVSYCDVSSGFYDIDKRLIYPSLAGLLQQRQVDTLALARRHADTQFIYSGKSTWVPEDKLQQNVHIGICRDLIANPDFLQHRHDGCKNMMKCHWYSRGRDYIDCGRWEVADRDRG
jgi:2,4-dienoyl-CoA reductase-like NADH-dependent reductase (Old Yellow Enzyme family)